LLPIEAKVYGDTSKTMLRMELEPKWNANDDSLGCGAYLAILSHSFALSSINETRFSMRAPL
jgi:hypothetical protein